METWSEPSPHLGTNFRQCKGKTLLDDIWNNAWSNHRALTIAGLVLLVVVAIFAFPIVAFCVFSQVIFMVTMAIMRLVTPWTLTLIAFCAGAGLLDFLPVLLFLSTLIIARWIMVFADWAYLPLNIVFMIAAFIGSIQNYQSISRDIFGLVTEQWVVVFLVGGLLLTALIIYGAREKMKEVYDVSASDNKDPKAPKSHGMLNADKTPQTSAPNSSVMTESRSPSSPERQWKEIKLSSKEQAIWDRIKAPGVE